MFHLERFAVFQGFKMYKTYSVSLVLTVTEVWNRNDRNILKTDHHNCSFTIVNRRCVSDNEGGFLIIYPSQNNSFVTSCKHSKPIETYNRLFLESLNIQYTYE